jgi:Tol biopolymer transport system component
MKKHVYYIVGISLVLFSVGVFAAKMYTKPTVPNTEQNPSSEKSMAFVREGKLYRGSVRNDKAPVRVEGTEGKEYVLVHTNHDKGMQLFIAWSENDHGKGELVLMNDDGTKKVIKTLINPIKTDASLSPDGKYIAFASGYEYRGYIIDMDGAVVQELPEYMFSYIVWNNAGTGVAYTKVSTTSCGKNGETNDIMDSEYCVDGLAFFDLESGEETLLTDSGEDYGVVNFSPDDTELYFQSTRAYDDNTIDHVNSVWVIDIATKETERLTNREYSDSVAYEPGLNKKDVLWSVENTVYTVYEGKVWKFDFSPTLKAPEFIMEGDTLRWGDERNSIVAHTHRDGRDMWETIPTQQ